MNILTSIRINGRKLTPAQVDKLGLDILHGPGIQTTMPKIYQHPRETWDAKQCEKAAKHVAKDGLGTPYPWPGYIGQYGETIYNGGCTRPRENGEWYDGENFPLPIVKPPYQIIHVSTWGYRIIRDITDQELRETLEKINWSKGKGDITNITIIRNKHGQPTHGTVNRKFPHAGNDTRKFSIKGNTINFLRAQRTIF
jgi:hypothetical protein